MAAAVTAAVAGVGSAAAPLAPPTSSLLLLRRCPHLSTRAYHACCCCRYVSCCCCSSDAEWLRGLDGDAGLAQALAVVADCFLAPFGLLAAAFLTLGAAAAFFGAAACGGCAARAQEVGKRSQSRCFGTSRRPAAPGHGCSQVRQARLGHSQAAAQL